MSSRQEARLREILSTIDPPASGISAAGLLQDGRRARRRRGQRRAAAAAGLVTLGLVAGVVGLADRPGGTPHQAPPAGTSASPVAVVCQAERLAVPAGTTEGNVNAGSPNGRYLAGVAITKDNPGKPVRWDGTRAEVIPIDGTGEANDVNDGGVAVGDGQTADRRHYAWAYAGGKVVELPIPEGYTGAEADAVNAAGEVAGVLFAGEKNVAAVWRSATATARVDVLEAPGPAMAFGIADSGVVVGGLANGGAYRWDANGRGSALAAPAGTEGGSALGVRGAWAYGLAQKNGGGETTSTAGVTVIDSNAAVVWDLGSGRARTVDDGRVEAIGAGGQVVVNHEDGTASVRAADGTSRALPGLAAEDKTHAYAISDDGSRAGGDSAGHPVRWSCAGKASR